MNKLVFANLVHRPIRSLISVIAVAIEFMMILSTVGILATSKRVPDFDLPLAIVTGIAAIVSFLVVFQAMYTAMLERTCEIGILKVMGASKLIIVVAVMRETAVLAICGILFGIAGTYMVRFLILHAATLEFQITARWIAQGSVIALTGSLLGAFYPAWMAARIDPIAAFDYD